MAEMKQSADVTVTAFEILQAVTGELPCYASPNWEIVRQEVTPARREGQNKTAFGKEKNWDRKTPTKTRWKNS